MLRAALIIAREERWPREEVEVLKANIQDALRSAANEVESWKDFAPKAVGEPPWLVKPFIVEQGITLVAGEQKSGKTFFTGYLIGLLLASNKRVLLVEEEGSAVMVRQRLEPFIPLEADGLFIAFRKQHELMSRKGIDRLIRMAQHVEADVIALDPLIFLMDGDENDTAAMRSAMQGVLRLATETGAGIILNHHVRKAPSSGRGNVTSADVRGSSTLMGAADIICLVQKREGEAGKVKFDITCGDSRYEPFEKLECSVKLGATGGMDLFLPKDVPERLSPLAKDIYRLVPMDGSAKGTTASALARALGRRKEAIIRATKELEDKGHVARHPHTLELFRNSVAGPAGTGREPVGNGSGNRSANGKPSSHAVPNGNYPLLSYGEDRPEPGPSSEPPEPEND